MYTFWLNQIIKEKQILLGKYFALMYEIKNIRKLKKTMIKIVKI